MLGFDVIEELASPSVSSSSGSLSDIDSSSSSHPEAVSQSLVSSLFLIMRDVALIVGGLIIAAIGVFSLYRHLES